MKETDTETYSDAMTHDKGELISCCYAFVPITVVIEVVIGLSYWFHLVVIEWSSSCHTKFTSKFYDKGMTTA